MFGLHKQGLASWVICGSNNSLIFRGLNGIILALIHLVLLGLPCPFWHCLRTGEVRSVFRSGGRWLIGNEGIVRLTDSLAGCLVMLPTCLHSVCWFGWGRGRGGMSGTLRFPGLTLVKVGFTCL